MKSKQNCLSRSGLSRRESLRRAVLFAGLSGLSFSPSFSFAAASGQDVAEWQPVNLKPVTYPGYGQDPNLIHPAPVPWPLTLSTPELVLLAVLSDILIPADGKVPSASAVKVPDVIDEWVSAPYPQQQTHRKLIAAGLNWCDREALRRFARPFVNADKNDQLAIVHDIAFPERVNRPGLHQELHQAILFFDLLRRLVTGMYYSSPEGSRELGYQGNVPINGDYPGPSAEAMAHLNEQLTILGLKL